MIDFHFLRRFRQWVQLITDTRKTAPKMKTPHDLTYEDAEACGFCASNVVIGSKGDLTDFVVYCAAQCEASLVTRRHRTRSLAIYEWNLLQQQLDIVRRTTDRVAMQAQVLLLQEQVDSLTYDVIGNATLTLTEHVNSRSSRARFREPKGKL